MTTLVGADIQEIDEVRKSIENFGDRYIHRIYTDDEIDDCSRGADSVGALACRFAAKEAMFKILTTGNPWESWKEVEVRSEESGHFTLVLRGAAAAQAAHQGISTISLSLSQSGGTATAVIIAEST